MFSRATPECAGATSDHDPLPLRIASAVVVLGLLATGLVVIYRDAAARGGPLSAGGQASGGLAAGGFAAAGLPGGGLAGRSLPSPRPTLAVSARPARAAGLRLLAEAAAACRSVAYQDVQVVVWWGAAGPKTSVVDVWHEPGRQALIQAVTAQPAPGLTRAEAGPDLDPDLDLGPDSVAADGTDAGAVMGMTPGMVALLGANYQVAAAGRGRVDGRSAQVVAVRRADGRLAARFWLDQATKLPLRREMFDASAREISEDVLVDLRLGAAAVVDAPAAAAQPWHNPVAAAQLAGLRARGWPLPGPLPDGLAMLAGSQAVTSSGPVVELSYSDGLFVVSLFVQRGYLPPKLNGWSKVAVRGVTVYAASPDERSVAWSARGFVYTLIADAPGQTLDQVVAALPHQGRPGFFARMLRGVHRLVSWVDPFH